METHEVVSCVRGYHIYGDTWVPNVGDFLPCEQERYSYESYFPREIGFSDMDCSALVTSLLAASISFLKITKVPIKLNGGCLIWRLVKNSPNRQNKSIVNYYAYTVHLCQI